MNGPCLGNRSLFNDDEDDPAFIVETLLVDRVRNSGIDNLTFSNNTRADAEDEIAAMEALFDALRCETVRCCLCCSFINLLLLWEFLKIFFIHFVVVVVYYYYYYWSDCHRSTVGWCSNRKGQTWGYIFLYAKFVSDFVHVGYYDDDHVIFLAIPYQMLL